MDTSSKEIIITDIHFKYKRNDGTYLWRTMGCQDYLYHLGLIPIKKREKSNGYYKYSFSELNGQNILIDDNEIIIYYI